MKGDPMKQSDLAKAAQRIVDEINEGTIKVAELGTPPTDGPVPITITVDKHVKGVFTFDCLVVGPTH